MTDAVDMVFAADSGGNFLVTPNVGLMIWTLIAFGIALFLLQRLAFPRIGEALDRRRKAIEESIEAAEHTRQEGDRLLEVDVTSAVELDEEIVKGIGQKIEEQTGQRVELTAQVDPDVIGGLVIRVGNLVLDASVRNRLERLRRQVASAA